MVGDRRALDIEGALPGEVPLLQRVMGEGKRLVADAPLEDISARAALAVSELPPAVQTLQDPRPLPVKISDGLERLVASTRKTQQSQTGEQTGGES